MKKHLFRLGNIKSLKISDRARQLMDDDEIQEIIDDINDEILVYHDSYAHYVGAEGYRQFIKNSYVDIELIKNKILFID